MSKPEVPGASVPTRAANQQRTQSPTPARSQWERALREDSRKLVTAGLFWKIPLYQLPRTAVWVEYQVPPGRSYTMQGGEPPRGEHHPPSCKPLDSKLRGRPPSQLHLLFSQRDLSLMCFANALCQPPVAQIHGAQVLWAPSQPVETGKKERERAPKKTNRPRVLSVITISYGLCVCVWNSWKTHPVSNASEKVGNVHGMQERREGKENHYACPHCSKEPWPKPTQLLDRETHSLNVTEKLLLPKK